MFCSLSYSHLSESGVRNDRRVHTRSAAAHLPHLLRHACCHGGLLRIPDQVSGASLPVSVRSACFYPLQQFRFLTSFTGKRFSFVERVTAVLTPCSYEVEKVESICHRGALLLESCDFLFADFSIKP